MPALALHQQGLVEDERVEGPIHEDLEDVAEVSEIGRRCDQLGAISEQMAVEIGAEAARCQAEERSRIGGWVALRSHQHAVHCDVRGPSRILRRGPNDKGEGL